MTNQVNAAAAYAANQAAIAKHIAFLQQQLADHAARAARQPTNYGFAGDLGHIEQSLSDLTSFLAA